MDELDSNSCSNKRNTANGPRVLYSFPYRIGAQRICATAGFQVLETNKMGARITVVTGSIGCELPKTIHTQTTLSAGCFRLPTRLFGHKLICDIHDLFTSRWLEKNASQIDVVHGWPLSSIRTIEVSKRKNIPFLLERPNAHTEYAYHATAEECCKLGIVMPACHDHSYDEESLRREEIEYHSADYLLCPSNFVLSSFKEKGFSTDNLIRHQYGYDSGKFVRGFQTPKQNRGLVMLYVGVCEPRKGLHYALQAWHKSGAQERGKFLICGNFIPNYYDKLRSLIEHPSVKVLGHREDIPELMRQSDVFVLSSVEEGSALVTYEAKASGCVLLVSEAAGAICEDLVDSMIHRIRDINTLSDHIRTLDNDRSLLAKLREESLVSSQNLTWNNAGKILADIYYRVT